LGDWIQRDIDVKRTKAITEYLHTQGQRFFNSLILGIYNGAPSWQDLNINSSKTYEAIDNEDFEYFSRTFGILTLSGAEDIFAIDGQHRAIGIREAVKKHKKLSEEEIPVIFVAHRTDEDGKTRTRRLFSTLNRYAKPVSQSEIIALSEDNNCAIVTRNIIDAELLKGKILINKNRSISPENTNAFTNIMTLYDIVKRLLTNENVIGVTVDGRKKEEYTTSRVTTVELTKDTDSVLSKLKMIIDVIPSLSLFFDNTYVDRKSFDTNLIFRPIGQNIIFDMLKIAEKYSKTNELLAFLAKDDFNLRNPIWNKVFWDSETENLLTDRPRQRYAVILMLEALGIPFKRTATDAKVYDSFDILAKDIGF
jgi:DNA sulfur modification protein DndB